MTRHSRQRNMKIVTTYLGKQHVRMLELLVEEGYYLNNSDAIRAAIDLLIDVRLGTSEKLAEIESKMKDLGKMSYDERRAKRRGEVYDKDGMVIT